MIARRRKASPAFSSCQTPWPSGPRFAIAAAILCSSGGSGGPAPTVPAMPHIATAELVLSVPRRVRRVVPVEIDEDVQVLGEVIIPEALQERPIDESLNVVLASRDAEERDPALESHSRPRPR